jgi:hypothetical protein
MQSVGGAVREIDEINPQQIDEDGHYCFAVAL